MTLSVDAPAAATAALVHPAPRTVHTDRHLEQHNMSGLRKDLGPARSREDKRQAAQKAGPVEALAAGRVAGRVADLHSHRNPADHLALAAEGMEPRRHEADMAMSPALVGAPGHEAGADVHASPGRGLALPAHTRTRARAWWLAPRASPEHTHSRALAECAGLRSWMPTDDPVWARRTRTYDLGRHTDSASVRGREIGLDRDGQETWSDCAGVRRLELLMTS